MPESKLNRPAARVRRPGRPTAVTWAQILAPARKLTGRSRMQALFPMARLASLAWVLAAAFSLFGHAALAEEILIQDISLDKPLVLDQDADYVLRNVSVTGLTDTAALTLSGRISSVLIENSSFGRVWSGMEGKAAGIECAGALVKTLIARKTTFFDSEHYLATL